MISINNVSRVYPQCNALLDINLKITAGEFVAIVGRSGSGKSTLLRIIGGVDMPSTGEVIYNEQSLQKMNEVQLAKFRNCNIGFVFQHFYLEPRYTVFQNVELPLLIGAVPKQKRNRMVEEQLEAINMIHKRDFKASLLSGGEKQRVAIARALICNPSVILADEPCGSLDVENGEMVMTLLNNIVKQGKTVVLITHNLEDAKKTNRIITLHNGSVTSDEYI